MKSQVGTLVKTMNILDALGEAGPLGVMELSRMLNMDKSSVSRLLSTLKSREYVRVLADGRHDLGLRLFELGHILQARMPVRQTLIPHVEALARETGETASVAQYHLGQISYLHDCISDKEIRFGGRVGLRSLPWHDVCGKAILAFCDEGYVLKCLKYDQLASNLPTPSQSELLAELTEVRKKGYAIERNNESCVIAAPIPCHHSPISLALMVGGPSSRLKKSAAKLLGLSAAKHARQAAQSLGWKSNP